MIALLQMAIKRSFNVENRHLQPLRKDKNIIKNPKMKKKKTQIKLISMPPPQQLQCMFAARRIIRAVKTIITPCVYLGTTCQHIDLQCKHKHILPTQITVSTAYRHTHT